MRRAWLDIEVSTGRRRLPSGGRRVAFSLVGMRLGDRILMEAPLRLHRKYSPANYLIAIADAHDGIDLPYALRRHFDEVWWISAPGGRKWAPSPRSAPARLVRDALVQAQVQVVLTALWQPYQFPRNRAYRLVGYSCFQFCNQLREFGIWPRYSLRPSERNWAREFLRSTIRRPYDVLVAVHVRNMESMNFKNPDQNLVLAVVNELRRHGRFLFLLIGRDDQPRALNGPDMIAVTGRDWHFDRTAALIAQTALYIGSDSGPTHAAAALGVPVIGLDYPSDRIRPFADPTRFIRFVKGESPQAILAEAGRFAHRVCPAIGRER